MTDTTTAAGALPLGEGPAALAATRPLPTGQPIIDVLDSAFGLMRNNLAAAVLIAAALVVPRDLISAYLDRAVIDALGYGQMVSDPFAALLAVEQASTSTAATVITWGMTALLGPVVSLAVARMTSSAWLSGQPLRAGEALGWAASRFLRAVGAFLLMVVVVLGPALLAVVLTALAALAGIGAAIAMGILTGVPALAWAVWAYPLTSLIFPVLAVEDVGAVTALRRSWRLAKPQWGRVIGVLMVSLVLIFLVQLALAGIPQAAGILLGAAGGWLAIGLGAVLAGLLTTPLSTCVSVALYTDVRVRTEALDIMVAASRLEARAG